MTLAYAAEGAALTVEDFSATPMLFGTDEVTATSSPGYGLTGMRERAELLGGELEAAPTETGFLVRLEVPA